MPKKYSDRIDDKKSGSTYAERKANGTLKPRIRSSRALIADTKKFIGYDSEGITLEGGEHITVLWANSEGDYIYNQNGLDREVVYEWFIACNKKYPHSINCVYGGSYDQNMLIKGISVDKARDLWDSKGDSFTFVGDYAIKIIPRRLFSVARFIDRTQPWVYDGDKKKLNICKPYLFYDVIGFFQDSFINVVKKNLGRDYVDYDLILEGKNLRHEFNNIDQEFIKKYCQAELRALVIIMAQLRDGLFKNEIKLKSWFGAGSIASAMMEKHGIKKCINREIEQPPLDILLTGFFGGRIEIMQYGNIDRTIYHDDVNSGYPYAMTLLPSMENGEWKYCNNGALHNEKLTLYHIKWKETDYSFKHRGRLSFNPFPWRNKNGRVIFPSVGESWVWSPELNAALEYIYIDSIEIIESWRFIPSNLDAPFEYINEYYSRRQNLINNGVKTFEEKVLKLGLNSGYGKTAQSLGATRSKPAPFQHFAYSGYITSYARAKMYKRAMNNPHTVIAFATDAIFSTEYLGDNGISDKKELGKWEGNIHDGIILAQSGIYFLNDGGSWKWKTRGIPTPKSYDDSEKIRLAILENWRDNNHELIVKRNVFITLGTALTGDNYPRHCSWEEEKKVIKLSPIGTKRKLINKNNRPHLGAVKTDPITIYDVEKTLSIISSPYNPKWRVEDDDQRELEDDELGLE